MLTATSVPSPVRSTGRGPIRSASRPTSGADIAHTRGRENTRSPVAETDSPATPVRYSGTATSTAARVVCWTNTPVALRSQRISTSRRGSMNGAALRSPATTNPASEATPRTTPRIGSQSGTPGCGAAVAAVISSATPAVSVPAPTPSIRVLWPLSRGTTRRVRTRTPMVTGTRAPKIARQPNASATRPPIGGPTACPMPFAAPQAPMTRLRRSGGKLRASMPMTAVGTAAQPRPWRPRLATRSQREGETAAPAVPASRTERARTSVRLRPSRSLIHPVRGIATARTRTDADATSTPWVTGAPKSPMICRSGTFTMLLLMVPSTVAPRRAPSSHARPRGGADTGGGVAAVPGRTECAGPAGGSGTAVLSLLLMVDRVTPSAGPAYGRLHIRERCHCAHRSWTGARRSSTFAQHHIGLSRIGATMHLTAAHWVFLAGVVVILVAMVMRKNIVVPAVVATFLTALVYTGSLATGLSSVFNASLVAATSLFNIFLIIAMVTAMLRSLEGLGADRRMVAPFRKVMRNGHLAFWTLVIVTYFISLFFWPTPAVPLIGAVLVPVAIRAGLRPLAVGFTVAIAGQGMALSSDYVIRVAPGLSATAASTDPNVVADRAFVLSLIVGGIALAIGYAMEVRKMRRPSDEWLEDWETAADRRAAVADAEEIIDEDPLAGGSGVAASSGGGGGSGPSRGTTPVGPGGGSPVATEERQLVTTHARLLPPDEEVERAEHIVGHGPALRGTPAGQPVTAEEHTITVA